MFAAVALMLAVTQARAPAGRPGVGSNWSGSPHTPCLWVEACKRRGGDLRCQGAHSKKGLLFLNGIKP